MLIIDQTMPTKTDRGFFHFAGIEQLNHLDVLRPARHITYGQKQHTNKLSMEERELLIPSVPGTAKHNTIIAIPISGFTGFNSDPIKMINNLLVM